MDETVESSRARESSLHHTGTSRLTIYPKHEHEHKILDNVRDHIHEHLEHLHIHHRDHEYNAHDQKLYEKQIFGQEGVLPVGEIVTFHNDLEKQITKEQKNEDCEETKKKKLVSVKDFENLKLLGVGSAGHVYLVRKKDNNHIYAMKVLKKDKLSERAQSRILTERNVLLNAHHPFISTLFFCFQTESKLFIVMQYCAGGDFYSVIKRQPHKCLLESQVKFYASSILLALEYLHFNGVIYRDLKPENILMRSTGHIVLTDFDLSIASPESVHLRVKRMPYSHKGNVVSEPDIQLNGGLIGTPEYIAPEIIEGKPYTCVVDWWSFGILIYEMLYGHTPFRGQDQKQTFENITKGHIEFPRHLREEEVSHKITNLIRELTHHKPKKRLGFEGGASAIKDHPFFNDVKFQLLVHQTPPIVPKLSSESDSHYFLDLKNDWKFDDEAETIDPATLPDNSIWKKFANIYRDTDPDEIKQSKLEFNTKWDNFR